MSDRNKPVTTGRRDVQAFLDKASKLPVKTGAVGRLVFGMDATASREPTWDRACHLQSQMFEATASIGNLAVQLCYYRGFNEFHASPWCKDARSLRDQMTGVRCLGGLTQIARVLAHARSEHQNNRIRAVVLVGDAVEEDADQLCHAAGQLGVLQIPLFMFHEGGDANVRRVFQQMAQLSGGAYAPFDLSSASELKDLLAAVAVFATGGRKALTRLGRGPVELLTQQLRD